MAFNKNLLSQRQPLRRRGINEEETVILLSICTPVVLIVVVVVVVVVVVQTQNEARETDDPKHCGMRQLRNKLPQANERAQTSHRCFILLANTASNSSCDRESGSDCEPEQRFRRSLLGYRYRASLAPLRNSMLNPSPSSADDGDERTDYQDKWNEECRKNRRCCSFS